VSTVFLPDDIMPVSGDTGRRSACVIGKPAHSVDVTFRGQCWSHGDAMTAYPVLSTNAGAAQR
jgi:hypothetical protein